MVRAESCFFLLLVFLAIELFCVDSCFVFGELFVVISFDVCGSLFD